MSITQVLSTGQTAAHCGSSKWPMHSVHFFVIDPKKCTECIGHFDEPQCAAVCPVDNTCVIDNSFPRY
ncbi:MAG: hypothetical protein ACK5CS_42140, partial [Bradyrhizobium sp.]